MLEEKKNPWELRGILDWVLTGGSKRNKREETCNFFIVTVGVLLTKTFKTFGG